MKKIFLIMLLLILSFTCYGNLPIKESCWRRLCNCLCPCFKSRPRQNYRRSQASLKRIQSNDNLKNMDKVPDYKNIEKEMIKDLQKAIIEKEEQIEKQIEKIKRNSLDVPLNN
jgi:hypothetical protein